MSETAYVHGPGQTQHYVVRHDPPPTNERLIRLALLGPVLLRRGDRGACGDPHVAPESPALRRKARALLAYLAEARGPVRREALATLFFPHTDDPLGALRWHLSTVRRQVDTALLTCEQDVVELNRERCWVDADAFESALEHPVVHDTARSLAACALYRDEYLAGLSLPDAPEFDMWLLGRRAYYRLRFERALVELVAHLVDDGRYNEALSWAHRLMQSNPFAEEAHLLLLRIYAHTGQRGVALAHYERYCHVLRSELATVPGPAVAELHRSIIALRSVSPRP